jgi:hypothetical protein
LGKSESPKTGVPKEDVGKCTDGKLREISKPRNPLMGPEDDASRDYPERFPKKMYSHIYMILKAKSLL